MSASVSSSAGNTPGIGEQHQHQYQQRLSGEPSHTSSSGHTRHLSHSHSHSSHSVERVLQQQTPQLQQQHHRHETHTHPHHQHHHARVDKSIQASLATAEQQPSARSRKSSHYMGLFKENAAAAAAKAAEKEKDKEAKKGTGKKRADKDKDTNVKRSGSPVKMNVPPTPTSVLPAPDEVAGKPDAVVTIAEAPEEEMQEGVPADAGTATNAPEYLSLPFKRTAFAETPGRLRLAHDASAVSSVAQSPLTVAADAARPKTIELGSLDRGIDESHMKTEELVKSPIDIGPAAGAGVSGGLDRKEGQDEEAKKHMTPAQVAETQVSFPVVGTEALIERAANVPDGEGEHVQEEEEEEEEEGQEGEEQISSAVYFPHQRPEAAEREIEREEREARGRGETPERELERRLSGMRLDSGETNEDESSTLSGISGAESEKDEQNLAHDAGVEEQRPRPRSRHLSHILHENKDWNEGGMENYQLKTPGIPLDLSGSLPANVPRLDLPTDEKSGNVVDIALLSKGGDERVLHGRLPSPPQLARDTVPQGPPIRSLSCEALKDQERDQQQQQMKQKRWSYDSTKSGLTSHTTPTAASEFDFTGPVSTSESVSESDFGFSTDESVDDDYPYDRMSDLEDIGTTPTKKLDYDNLPAIGPSESQPKHDADNFQDHHVQQRKSSISNSLTYDDIHTHHPGNHKKTAAPPPPELLPVPASSVLSSSTPISMTTSGANTQEVEPSRSPLGAVELKPYKHQVGGHTTVFRFSRRAICKQLNNRENMFYERIERRHPEMLVFLPRYIGVLNVTFLKVGKKNKKNKDKEKDKDKQQQPTSGSIPSSALAAPVTTPMIDAMNSNGNINDTASQDAAIVTSVADDVRAVNANDSTPAAVPQSVKFEADRPHTAGAAFPPSSGAKATSKTPETQRIVSQSQVTGVIPKVILENNRHILPRDWIIAPSSPLTALSPSPVTVSTMNSGAPSGSLSPSNATQLQGGIGSLDISHDEVVGTPSPSMKNSAWGATTVNRKLQEQVLREVFAPPPIHHRHRRHTTHRHNHHPHAQHKPNKSFTVPSPVGDIASSPDLKSAASSRIGPSPRSPLALATPMSITPPALPPATNAQGELDSNELTRTTSIITVANAEVERSNSDAPMPIPAPTPGGTLAPASRPMRRRHSGSGLERRSSLSNNKMGELAYYEDDAYGGDKEDDGFC
ncbi:Inositol hexakisphosphate kinase 1, partial [Ascosphaera pollenicola]